MSTKGLEAALMKAAAGGASVTYIDGVVKSTSPYLVQTTGSDEPFEVEALVSRAPVDARVAVFGVGPHRFALPFA